MSRELSPIGALPSALDDYHGFRRHLGGRRPALFLDYDGTLTPIAARPELATLAPAARAVVAAVARRLPVAVISGRDRADVARLLGIDGIATAGSHGFDIRLADGREMTSAAIGDVDGVLSSAAARLRTRLAGVAGALVERKRFGLAVHYRLVDPAEAGAVRDAVTEALAAAPGLTMKPGKMMFELLPAGDWDKGRALLWLRRALALDSEFPLFLGDDVTDEDAFRALCGIGLGIVVANPAEDGSRRTAARYRLDDPPAVLRFLRRLAEDADGTPPKRL